MMFNPYQRTPNDMLKMLRNPQSAVERMPQYKQIMEYVKANGGDPKAAFYAKAKEIGVDPEEVLKMLK